MNSECTTPRGFSLVELLAVISIIGILVSLALMAVQYSRASARKAQCLNQLRQHGLAVQTHESSHRHLPTNGWGYGWMGLSDRGFGVAQPGGWIFNILPFCELQAVRDQAPSSSDNPIDAARIAAFASQPQPFFQCPERRRAMNRPARLVITYYGVSTITECAKSDYVINGGNTFFRSVEGPPSLLPSDVARYAWPDTSGLNGVSFVRSTIRYGDLTDGTSNILLIGEKWAFSADGTTRGDDQPMFAGDCLDIRRWGHVAPSHDRYDDGNETGFGSAHAGAAGFVLCDASTRAIPYYIDPKVFATLCARNDGGSLADDDAL